MINARSDEKRPKSEGWRNITKSSFDGSGNVCIITGHVSGITVVDVDNKLDTIKRFNKMLQEHDSFNTLVSKTLNGGYHYYFKYDPDIKTTTGVNGLKIDIRNDGAIAIAPPSKYVYDDREHEDNLIYPDPIEVEDSNGDIELYGFYEWLNDNTPIEMPIWLKNWIMQHKKYKHHTNKVEEIGEIEEIDRDELRKLLEKFPYSQFYVDRESWLYFMTLVWNAGGDWKLAHQFSKRLPNHKPCTCEKTFHSLTKRYTKPLQRLRDIIDKFNNREDDEYIKKDSHVKMCKFDFNDQYDVYDFKEEFASKKWEDNTIVYNEVHSKLSKVCAYVSEIDSFIVKAGNKIVNHKTVSKVLPMNYIKGSKGWIQLNWDKFIANEITLTYDTVDYILKDNKNIKLFNKWQGYNAKIIDNPDQNVIDAVLDVIRKVFADDQDDLFHYVVSWLSNLVSSHERNNVGLVLISDQGVGKGNIMELMNLIMGNHCCDISVTGISQITQKHNTCIEGKRLIVINEMSSTRDEFKSNFDKIKSYITDPYVKIEPKGIPSFNCSNIGNYIMVSNHEDAIVIEDSDRRYQVLKCSTIYQNNFDFWGKWRKLCLTEHGANSFYTYLMSYKKCNLLRLIDTPLKQEMKERGLPSTVRYISHYKEVINSLEGTYQNIKEVRANNLYQQYVEWCKTNNEKLFSNTKFGTDIKNITIKKHKMDGWWYYFE